MAHKKTNSVSSAYTLVSVYNTNTNDYHLSPIGGTMALHIGQINEVFCHYPSTGKYSDTDSPAQMM
jgi:hypothetical protein